MSDIEQALLAARLIRPYYSRALAALTPIESKNVETVAVDKYWRLYYNPDFLESIDDNQAGLIISAHEVEHLLRNHNFRCEKINANPELWNIAADAEINDDIKENIDIDIVTPRKLNLKDNELAEYYYENIKGKISFNPSCSGGSGAGNKKDFEIDKGIAPSVSAEESEILIEQTAKDVISHKEKGNVPENILMWANAHAAKVKIDWRRILSANVSRHTRIIERGKSDYSYSKISRRSNSNVIRPGLITRQARIGILVDTSGSMSEFGDFIFSHCKKICNQYGHTKIYGCDTVVNKVKKFKFIGGGGSDIRSGLELACQENDIVVVISDGETIWPNNNIFKNKIFGLTTSKCYKNYPSWIKLINIE